jgi:hypothetical protein
MKDRTTNKPVPAVVVTALHVDPESEKTPFERRYSAPYGGSAATDLDGAYSLEIPSLKERQTFWITYEYFTEGGSAWAQPQEVVAEVELGSGDKEEVNLLVDAPVKVPVRYVDSSGLPLKGVMAAMRRAGGRGGCGGVLESDAEGRVTFHGIPPYVELQALAWEKIANELATVGVSEPFAGGPGETVPEVLVMVAKLGGIEGGMTDSEGSPAAGKDFMARVWHADGSTQDLQGRTDANGVFTLLDVLPQGEYPRIGIGYEAEGHVEAAILSDVTIVGDHVTDLGNIALQVFSLEEVEAILSGA